MNKRGWRLAASTAFAVGSLVATDAFAAITVEVVSSRADLVSLLHRDAKILSTEYEDNDILVTAVVPESIAGRLAAFATSA